mgnify:CR=1 FL=1
MKKCECCGQEIKTAKWVKIGDLEWYYDYLPEMTWEEAKEECKKLGGRLPTRMELIDLFDNHREEIKKLSNSPAYNFWSSTEVYSSATYAWGVGLSYGLTFYNGKSNGYYVRCVRR